ncbi:MAG: hypothetical protein ACC658_00095 [Acidimicrobiia bacterium]
MPTRMPVSVGSRKGLSKVIAIAEDERVVLTSHGRAVAVVDSAERLDEDLRQLRKAADEVIEFATRSAVDGVEKRWDLDSACDRLGLDSSLVRERARTAKQK